LGLDLVEGDVDVLVQVEHDRHHRGAGRGGGLNALDARHAVDGGLDDVGNGRVDDVGVRSRHDGSDRHHRELDVREAVHAQPAVGDHTEQDEHGVDHERQHRLANGKCWQRHLATLPPVLDVHCGAVAEKPGTRSEEHTSNSSHVKISYAVFCLKKKTI